ncbi:MAG TPA: T9SS type A sorting domain-containing protein [Flavobacteriales bacterium]|nr:T9SS type A sorting domain-containing protein [Flavobacteriales bacterium]
MVSLQVFDARGRQVHNEVFQASGSKTTRNPDLSRLAKGSYTLTLLNAEATVSQRLVLE